MRVLHCGCVFFLNTVKIVDIKRHLILIRPPQMYLINKKKTMEHNL